MHDRKDINQNPFQPQTSYRLLDNGTEEIQIDISAAEDLRDVKDTIKEVRNLHDLDSGPRGQCVVTEYGQDVVRITVLPPKKQNRR